VSREKECLENHRPFLFFQSSKTSPLVEKYFYSRRKLGDVTQWTNQFADCHRSPLKVIIIQWISMLFAEIPFDLPRKENQSTDWTETKERQYCV
jgi:hypothetical protein